MVEDNVTTLKLGRIAKGHTPKEGDVYKYNHTYYLLVKDGACELGSARAFSLNYFANHYSETYFELLRCVEKGEYITTLKLEE